MTSGPVPAKVLRRNMAMRSWSSPASCLAASSGETSGPSSPRSRLTRESTREVRWYCASSIDGAVAAGAVAEEPGIAIGQAEQSGALRAIVGAAEDPDLGSRRALREGLD